jgi:hypothetical protein
MLQHGEHDDGKSACERYARLAQRRSPGNVERPVFERETAAVAGQHHIGGLIEQCAEPPVAAFGDAAGVIDLTGLITPRDQAQISAHIGHNVDRRLMLQFRGSAAAPLPRRWVTEQCRVAQKLSGYESRRPTLESPRVREDRIELGKAR